MIANFHMPAGMARLSTMRSYAGRSSMRCVGSTHIALCTGHRAALPKQSLLSIELFVLYVQARAAQDRVVLHHATDTFTGRKNHNEDRYASGMPLLQPTPA
jgi:hypothetical protein